MPKEKEIQEKIRVLIVDDHPVILEGVRRFLTKTQKVEIVGEVKNGLEALEKCGGLEPDVVLMDLNIPGLNGSETTKLIRSKYSRTRILVFTAHDAPGEIKEAMRCGAHGYLLKDGPLEMLLQAIEAVHQGQSFFSPEVAQVLLNDYVIQSGNVTGESVLDVLSDREKEVLRLIAGGHLNKEIATELGVSVRTIESHREKLMKKLDIHSVAGLTQMAISSKLIALD